MYADDTTLLSTLQNFTSNHSNNSLSYNVNVELTKITQWLAVNRLSLNAKKTKMMIFHSKQNKLSINEIPIIKINDMPIERVTLLPCPIKSRPTSGDSHDRLPPGVPISS